jgi:hypothetical protein
MTGHLVPVPRAHHIIQTTNMSSNVPQDVWWLWVAHYSHHGMSCECLENNFYGLNLTAIIGITLLLSLLVLLRPIAGGGWFASGCNACTTNLAAPTGNLQNIKYELADQPAKKHATSCCIGTFPLVISLGQAVGKGFLGAWWLKTPSAVETLLVVRLQHQPEWVQSMTGMPRQEEASASQHAVLYISLACSGLINSSTKVAAVSD